MAQTDWSTKFKTLNLKFKSFTGSTADTNVRYVVVSQPYNPMGMLMQMIQQAYISSTNAVKTR